MKLIRNLYTHIFVYVRLGVSIVPIFLQFFIGMLHKIRDKWTSNKWSNIDFSSIEIWRLIYYRTHLIRIHIVERKNLWKRNLAIIMQEIDLKRILIRISSYDTVLSLITKEAKTNDDNWYQQFVRMSSILLSFQFYTMHFKIIA